MNFLGNSSNRQLLRHTQAFLTEMLNRLDSDGHLQALATANRLDRTIFGQRPANRFAESISRMADCAIRAPEVATLFEKTPSGLIVLQFWQRTHLKDVAFWEKFWTKQRKQRLQAN
jgi:hypothetical protein